MKRLRQDYLRQLAACVHEIREAAGDGYDASNAQYENEPEDQSLTAREANALDYEITRAFLEVCQNVSYLNERLYKLERLWPEANTYAKTNNRIAQFRVICAERRKAKQDARR